MDPTTIELLSRFLDGDLDAGEAEQFEQRLADEPELAAELEAMSRLQQRVRAVAERMEPPTELDSILLPLQRGATAPPRRIHPAVRWMGLAAGLALAVTVAVEVARHPSEPPPAPTRSLATPAPPPKPSEFFQLKPLPTSPAPAGEEPLGAADRLLASPPAEVPLPEPEPLDVRGPLSEREAIGGAGALGHAKGDGPKSTRSAEEEESDRAGETKQRAAPDNQATASAESVAGAIVAPSAARLQDEARSTATSGRDRAKKEMAPSTRLVLVGADGARVAEVEVPPAAAGWPMPLVVTVANGVIVEIETANVETEAARDTLVGRTVPGLADGRYRGAVETRDQPP